MTLDLFALKMLKILINSYLIQFIKMFLKILLEVYAFKNPPFL